MRNAHIAACSGKAQLNSRTHPPGLTRPILSEQMPISEFLSDWIRYKKAESPRFSIRSECKKVEGLSPALFTLWCQGKRNPNRSHLSRISQILGLTRREALILDQRFEQRFVNFTESDTSKSLATKPAVSKRSSRKSLMTYWQNPLVLAAFDLQEAQRSPEAARSKLSAILSTKQFDQAFRFLTREGFLRRTLDGRWVKNSEVETSSEDISVKQIQQFHTKALHRTADAVQALSVHERKINTLLLTVDDHRLKEVSELVSEFYEKLLQLAERPCPEAKRLIQISASWTPLTR